MPSAYRSDNQRDLRGTQRKSPNDMIYVRCLWWIVIDITMILHGCVHRQMKRIFDSSVSFFLLTFFRFALYFSLSRRLLSPWCATKRWWQRAWKISFFIPFRFPLSSLNLGEKKIEILYYFAQSRKRRLFYFPFWYS